MTKSNKMSSTEERFRRLPKMAQDLIRNPHVAMKWIAVSPLARVLTANGVSLYRDFGVAEFDACIALLKDGLGLEPLTDAEFEQALLTSTPPEHRSSKH